MAAYSGRKAEDLNVLIVGGGLAGLTAGIEFRNAGYKANIITREEPGNPRTASANAGAFWAPYMDEPDNVERHVAWARSTFNRYREMVLDPKTGVTLRPVVKVYSEKPASEPWWVDACDKFVSDALSHQLPDNFPKGFTYFERFDSFSINPLLHLQYLSDQFSDLGGSMHLAEVKRLEDGFDLGDIVINCTGLDAKKLANDTAIYPARGHYFLLTKDVKLELPEFVLADTELAGESEIAGSIAASIPSTGRRFFGVTYETGNDSLTIDRTIMDRVKASIFTFYPELGELEDDKIIEGVGIRAVRKGGIRVEIEERDNGKVMGHLYGLGGAGFSTAHGCAEELVGLVDKHLGIIR